MARAHPITLTNPDRIVYPVARFTKRQEMEKAQRMGKAFIDWTRKAARPTARSSTFPSAATAEARWTRKK